MDSFVFGRFLEIPQSQFREKLFRLFTLHNSCFSEKITIRFF